MQDDRPSVAEMSGRGGAWLGRQGCAFWLVACVVAVLMLGQCGDTPTPTPTLAPDPAASAAPMLDAAAVRECRAYLKQAVAEGLIRERPAPARINVDERLWAEMPARVKDLTLQAVACDLWQSSMPPEWEHVAAYGWRSGKRVQMLTSVGMDRGD